MAKKFKQTFREIAAEARERAESAPHQGRGDRVRAGSFNREGEFFDPSGIQLHLASEEITPAQAADAVNAGALLAFERCGCGGGVGGCQIEWFEPQEVTRSGRRGDPAFVEGYGSPTWIDLWSGDDDRRVVFAHGDVQWGSILI